MQTLAGSFSHFRKLLETERCIHKVSKNNARRFGFVTEKQSCSLIQECFGESRISLDPSHYGFLEITSERRVNYLLRFSALLAAAFGALRDLYSVCNATARSISACCRRFVPSVTQTSPAFIPGGQVLMRTPHSSTMPAEAEAVQRESDVLHVIGSTSLTCRPCLEISPSNRAIFAEGSQTVGKPQRNLDQGLIRLVPGSVAF